MANRLQKQFYLGLLTLVTLPCFVHAMEETKPADITNPSEQLFQLIEQNKENSEKTIRLLLKRGAQPDWIEPKSENSTLHIAVQNLNPNIVRLLVPYVKNINVTATIDLQTPLHRAMVIHTSIPNFPVPSASSISANPKAIETLHKTNSKHLSRELKAQEDIDLGQEINNDHARYVNKTLQIIALLLRNGADPVQKDLNGLTPINVADNNKNDKAKALCTDSLACLPNIHSAIVTLNKTQFFELLAKPEAPIHGIHTDTGNTFLHDAVLRENITVSSQPVFIKKLICEGLDVNKRNNKGETAFYIACQQKKKLMVLYLLFYCPNLDITITDNSGSSALGYWLANEWSQMLLHLIELGYRSQEEPQIKEAFDQLPNL